MATTLKSSVYTDSNCVILINNNTYFRDGENPTGFWTPGDLGTPEVKDYYINDVYFFNYVIVNSYLGTKSNLSTVSNVGILIDWDEEDETLTFPGLMNKYDINIQPSLSSDGYITIYQLCIPKESIKNEARAGSTYKYYVKDDGNVYTVINNIETQVDLLNLIKTTTDWSSTNILEVHTDIISKCYLDLCLNLILEQFAINYTDPLCSKDNISYKTIKEKRDLLFAVNSTIQYYTDLGQYYKAAKLIYDVTFCNVCREFILNNPNLNCNCNG